MMPHFDDVDRSPYRRGGLSGRDLLVRDLTWAKAPYWMIGFARDGWYDKRNGGRAPMRDLITDLYEAGLFTSCIGDRARRHEYEEREPRA